MTKAANNRTILQFQYVTIIKFKRNLRNLSHLLKYENNVSNKIINPKIVAVAWTGGH